MFQGPKNGVPPPLSIAIKLPNGKRETRILIDDLTIFRKNRGKQTNYRTIPAGRQSTLIEKDPFTGGIRKESHK
jgi:hypothetical protein